MEKGTCRLCLTEVDLCKSHIMPNFFLTKLEEAHPDKKIRPLNFSRPSTNPNHTVNKQQTLLNKPLLCEACEAVFNSYETYFSNNFFMPTGKPITIEYF